MSTKKRMDWRLPQTPFDREGHKEPEEQLAETEVPGKELLETEGIFRSIEEVIAWRQTLANVELRNRLVWFGIASFGVEMLFVFLHSAGMINLPGVVVYAVSVLMGGSGFGLGSLLFYIAKDLFRNR